MNFRPIRGGYIKSMAMFGNGEKIAGTLIMAGHQLMVRHGRAESAKTASGGAARGSITRRLSAPRSEVPILQKNARISSASGLPGRLHHNAFHLYTLTAPAKMIAGETMLASAMRARQYYS